MIYIIEIPHQLPAACWTAIDRADFIRAVQASAAQKRSSCTIYSAATVRQLAEEQDIETQDHDAMTAAGLATLAEKFGLNTAIFHGPDWGCNPEWTATDPGEFDACRQYLAEDLHALHIIEDDAQALATWKAGAPEWGPHQHGRALDALRERLEAAGLIDRIQIMPSATDAPAGLIRWAEQECGGSEVVISRLTEPREIQECEGLPGDYLAEIDGVVGILWRPEGSTLRAITRNDGMPEETIFQD